MLERFAEISADLGALYEDLHAHPELSFAEHRTAGIVAGRLTSLGLEVTTGVGRTGVVGVLRNGEGPLVMLRADFDALPVEEKTGLPYASTATGTDPDGATVPVMHACGHDMHVTCLLGALDVLAAARASWSGTLLAVFQPAEELGAGAQAMIDDGLFTRFGTPSVILGQHVGPLPPGMAGLHPGPAFAASDSLRVTLHGRGGHGSRPEGTIDPIVMAASAVMRLQTIVSRELPATETAVVTVGALRAGTKDNIIPDRAELMMNVRSYTEETRGHALDAIHRIIGAEAAASAAPAPPDYETLHSFPATVNDHEASARTAAALSEALGPGKVIDPGPVTGSEDVGLFATASGAPLCYWIFGGTEDLTVTNHSPHFAPVPAPTIRTGVTALVAAARAWLA
ncbi:amidohydrolase [Actinocorallia longicatena]|uniref:M20 family metallopeptidase n=1 Tax=Actinocorallia longicatena TaxID=111803 RepID=A0ABP6Q2A0_9ACTN